MNKRRIPLGLVLLLLIIDVFSGGKIWKILRKIR